jgi:hypothetical protein
VSNKKHSATLRAPSGAHGMCSARMNGDHALLGNGSTPTGAAGAMAVVRLSDGYGLIRWSAITLCHADVLAEHSIRFS